MPYSRFSGSLSSPKVDVVIDMGNPFLNRTVDGFLKIGTVSASRVAAEETYHCIKRGSVSKHKIQETSLGRIQDDVTIEEYETLDGVRFLFIQSVKMVLQQVD
ncbi:hypothetical protein QJS04_geneDACA025067 [Acorus gramineus]|uniref:Uncharacterized protein n=1 Tax=Acorus gramineus TaxID=55184 RepID=A0AAV8ZWK2_ACOGR|nr:hypothetical protein QJS04_geneDACA025067 [Acorus gramineus]